MLKKRKFKFSIHPTISFTAKDLFDRISLRYTPVYVGISSCENQTLNIYINLKNAFIPSKIMDFLCGIGINIITIETSYTKIEGTLCSQHGTVFKCGRPRIQISPSPPSPKPSPPSPKPSPRSPPSDPHFQCGIPHMDDRSRDFHAIWGSVHGNWFPFGYIGPDRNIVPGKRRAVSEFQTQELFREQGDSCASCGCDVFMGKLSNADVDHIIPLRLGGSCCTSNLQILCVTCHRRKTALECKKIRSNVIVGPEVELKGEALYIVCSDMNDPEYEIVEKSPKDALRNRDGMFRLVY